MKATTNKPSNAKKYIESINALSKTYKVKVTDFRNAVTYTRTPFMIELVNAENGRTSIIHKTTASEALEYIKAEIEADNVRKWGA